VAAFITAPIPAKLIPKGMFSVGAVAHLLVEKFEMGRPISRSLRLIRLVSGVDISEGTVAGVMEKIGPLIRPLYREIVERNRLASHWHADETRWSVFEDVEGKSGHRWWMWVFSSKDTVVFILDPSRGSEVPRGHLDWRKEDKAAYPSVRILSTDMYRGYVGIYKVRHSYCWAHVRRHFIETSQGYPEALEDWGNGWVERIGRLYQLNNKRLDARRDSPEYEQAQTRLREQVGGIESIMHAQMADPNLHKKGKDVLYMLARHWEGLTVFLDYPEVPLDNNEAERLLRIPVVGRKNFYGSGSAWSGDLAAMMFSILATAKSNGLNPLTYLQAYLQACAQAGGNVPDTLERFLPWKVSDEDRNAWQNPHIDTS
jgi:transposase